MATKLQVVTKQLKILKQITAGTLKKSIVENPAEPGSYKYVGKPETVTTSKKSRRKLEDKTSIMEGQEHVAASTCPLS